jgi:hypothetical protein
MFLLQPWSTAMSQTTKTRIASPAKPFINMQNLPDRESDRRLAQ